mgnify:CR=1 FL=1
MAMARPHSRCPHVPQPLVLIVDDNPENLSVVGELLLPQHAVRVANSGRRALQLARLAPRPDLVLLDVMMPRKTGLEVCQEVRAEARLQGVRILMLTAKGRDTDVAKGLALGANAYVTKPFSTRDLVARVRSLLEERP